MASPSANASVVVASPSNAAPIVIGANGHKLTMAWRARPTS
ncbi:MAG: hypothetical protein AAF721_00660 [Myxococcota bacterium]